MPLKALASGALDAENRPPPPLEIETLVGMGGVLREGQLTVGSVAFHQALVCSYH
jgi:hypothetical protein